MADIVLNDLTTASIDGDGVFDTLMRATKAHLEEEYNQNRIKGNEYATVYLGALDNVMGTALQFLMSNQKANLETKILEQQLILAQVEVIKANAIVEQTKAQTELLAQQIENEKAQLEIIKANALKVPAEIAQLTAQTALTEQQKINLVDNLQTQVTQREQVTQETANLVKQGLILDQQRANLTDELQTSIAQRARLVQETTNLALTAEGIVANTAQTKAQTELVEVQKAQANAQIQHLNQEITNLVSQDAQIKAQTAQVTQQTSNLASTKLQIESQTSLIAAQQANEVLQGDVLKAQTCKLKAEYDLTVASTTKANQETSLLSQKTATERAQITALGVDEDSVLGRQKGLYLAQTNGFTRDAEQKAAKILVDSWNVRRTTDDATVADSTNMLNDATVGRTVTKLLAGVNA